MNKAIHTAVLTLIAAVTFTGCAKEVVETDSEASLRAFTAWVNAHYPDVKDTTGCGIYVISDKEGDGDPVRDSSYIFQEYEIRALSDSSIVAYSGDSLAKQLGQYSRAAYYGPNIFLYNKTTTKAGLKDLLNGNGNKWQRMRIGGERIAIIPAAFSPTNADCIYRIKVVDQKKDIVQWQIDEIEKYMKAHNIEIGDTTGHKGLYYWRDRAREQGRGVTVIDTVKFPSDTTIYINYVGRHLNGQAFDTNIKDSAKVNGIYSASASYGPSSVTWSADSTAIKLGGSSVIKGFSLTLWHMHPFESGQGLFISDYGYGSSGNDGIGAYEPLIFEIDIVKKE